MIYQAKLAGARRLLNHGVAFAALMLVTGTARAADDAAPAAPAARKMPGMCRSR